jgi:hypothetical protein
MTEVVSFIVAVQDALVRCMSSVTEVLGRLETAEVLHNSCSIPSFYTSSKMVS